MGAKLAEMVDYLDGLLGHDGFADYPGAHNGLQVQNGGTVSRVGAAVDSHAGVIERAVAAGVDLLIVHHGLFWGPAVPWTGTIYRKMKLAVTGNLAVFSSHLPLDAHSRFGNNALLARKLGFTKTRPFFEAFGRPIGRRAATDISIAELTNRLEKAVGGPVHPVHIATKRARTVGIVTGGAGNDLARAAAEGIDTFITGEGAHHTFGTAKELGVNLLYAGHYATETFGVRALAEHIAKKWRLPWVFLDAPSGL